ncbi:MAG: acyltransferase family protein [Halioglobus sp.]
MKNRNIQTLRALAVLLVLLFHLDVGFLSGGFLGVDVFLVISGFLIAKSLDSSAIKQGLSSNTILGFYARRIDRIFPPLIVTILLTVLAGLLIYSPAAAEKLYVSGLTGLLGISNIHFYLTTDYFSDSNIYKPLLHTWSLGLELQFYLIFPAIYLLMAKLKRGKLILFIFAASSLLLAALASNEPQATAVLSGSGTPNLLSPHASYYLLPFRLFEFLAGSYAYLLTSRANAPQPTLGVWQYVVCLLVIFGSAVFLDNDDALPGLLSLPAVLATSYALYLQNVKLPNIVSGGLLGKIGDASYSIYLVHWPIICFASYLVYLDPLLKLGIFVTSLCLGYLFYWVIESRRIKQFSLYSPWKLAFAAAVISTAGLAALKPDLRLEDQKVLDKMAKANVASRYKGIGAACSLIKLDRGECGSNLSKVLIIGDSHEPDGFEILTAADPKNEHYEVIAFGLVQDCGFYFDVTLKANNTGKESCNLRASALSRALDTHAFQTIVVNTFKPIEWGRGVLAMLRDMRSSYPSFRLVIMSSYVGIRPYKCIEVVNLRGTPRSCFDQGVVSHFGLGEADKIEHFFSGQQVDVLDKVKLLCKDNTPESCKSDVNGIPAFFDGDHLSVDFSRYIGGLVDPEFFLPSNDHN